MTSPNDTIIEPGKEAEMHKILLTAVIALTVSAGSLAAAPPAYKEPLDAKTLDTIRSEFSKLMELWRFDCLTPFDYMVLRI